MCDQHASECGCMSVWEIEQKLGGSAGVYSDSQTVDLRSL